MLGASYPTKPGTNNRCTAKNPGYPGKALFQDNSALGGEGSKYGPQGMVGPAAQPVHKGRNLPQVQAANHHLDRADLAGLHGQCTQAQPQQRHGVQRPPRHLAAQTEIAGILRSACTISRIMVSEAGLRLS